MVIMNGIFLISMSSISIVTVPCLSRFLGGTSNLFIGGWSYVVCIIFLLVIPNMALLIECLLLSQGS